MGIICDSDKDLMTCILGEANEIMANVDVLWFKFNQVGTVTDDVYDGAVPAFDAPVSLRGVADFDVQEEDLTAYGTFERGTEDDDIERPDVLVELPRYNGAGVPYGISNADEFEILGKRYHCIGIKEPIDIITTDTIIIAYLLEKQ